MRCLGSLPLDLGPRLALVYRGPKTLAPVAHIQLVVVRIRQLGYKLVGCKQALPVPVVPRGWQLTAEMGVQRMGKRRQQSLRRAALVMSTVLACQSAVASACELPVGQARVVPKTMTGSSIPQLHVTVVLDALPEKVWRVITDCNGYKHSMPRTIASKEIARTGARSVCETEVHMPFPFANLHSQVEFVDTVVAGRWSRTYRQLRGDYTKSEGSWVVTPCGPDGSQSLVEYEMHAVLRVAVPDGMIRRGQVSAMHEMFGKIRQLARK